MPAVIATPLVVLAWLVLLFGLALGFFVLRRISLSRRPGTFDCSLRRLPHPSAGGWMLGVAHFQVDRLDWFRLFGVALRPRYGLDRTALEVQEWFVSESAEADSLLPGSVIVRCRHGDEALELAMTRADYTRFSIWLESAPPGLPPLSQ